jgi:uncharacterized protein YbaA (DUF1428 family)
MSNPYGTNRKVFVPEQAQIRREDVTTTLVNIFTSNSYPLLKIPKYGVKLAKVTKKIDLMVTNKLCQAYADKVWDLRGTDQPIEVKAQELEQLCFEWLEKSTVKTELELFMDREIVYWKIQRDEQHSN